MGRGSRLDHIADRHCHDLQHCGADDAGGQFKQVCTGRIGPYDQPGHTFTDCFAVPKRTGVTSSICGGIHSCFFQVKFTKDHTERYIGGLFKIIMKQMDEISTEAFVWVKRKKNSSVLRTF